VYRGERLASLDHVAANRRFDVVSVTADGFPVWGTIFTDAVFFAQKGDVYRVRLAHGEPSLPLVLRWRQGPRPGNDDFLNAEVLTGLEGSVDGTNLGATLESGESLGPAAATTWYRWTAPGDGQWQFEVDADRLLRVAAFKGNDVGDLRLVSGFPTTEASSQPVAATNTGSRLRPRARTSPGDLTACRGSRRIGHLIPGTTSRMHEPSGRSST
ncbi:MAG: hypothetical protein OXG44_07850, partial [Gammaproteobacteria bacterium]|nr:hypothetical protein [Gammaproteobacteria bacterium]